jgi:hypothetical protein
LVDANADLNFIQELPFGQTMKDIGTINLIVVGNIVGGGVVGAATEGCLVLSG